jgi:hypothetical protein
MTTRSDRRHPHLALRARYLHGEITITARDRFAIGALVLVIVAAATVVVALLS